MKLTNRTIQDAKMITKVTLHTYTRAWTIMDIGKDNSVENMKTAGSLQKKGKQFVSRQKTLYNLGQVDV